MNQTTARVEDNLVVNVAYILNSGSGQKEPSKEKQSAKQIVQGRHQVVPGLERALYGMKVGEEKDVVVEPLQAYGEVNPEAVQTLARNSVPSFAQAIPGQKLRLLHKKSGTMRRATVVNVNPDTIVLDFNHPLAGKTLHFHVRVDDIREATAHELESGQVTAATSEETTAE